MYSSDVNEVWQGPGVYCVVSQTSQMAAPGFYYDWHDTKEPLAKRLTPKWYHTRLEARYVPDGDYTVSLLQLLRDRMPDYVKLAVLDSKLRQCKWLAESLGFTEEVVRGIGTALQTVEKFTVFEGMPE